MIYYIAIAYIIYRLIRPIWNRYIHVGLIGAASAPVVINGIRRMNNIMQKWEDEDENGVKYPRFRLLDWFLPAIPRKPVYASRQLKRFIRENE